MEKYSTLELIGKYYFNKNIKLIIGAGGKKQKGFISTDIDILDIRNWWHWRRLFRKNSISAILSEHVFEHLNEKELDKSLKLIYKYLSKKGILRIAVPDKNRRDKKYVSSVKPPIDGHKSYYNLSSLKRLLVKNKFKVKPLEYFDKAGNFIYIPCDTKFGKIDRSFKFDRQIKFKRKNYFYTSLIVDAIKI